MFRKDEKGRVMDGNDPDAYYIELERRGDVEDYRNSLGGLNLTWWAAHDLFFKNRLSRAELALLWLVQSQRFGCSRTNAFIAEVLGLSVGTVREARAKLLELQFVKNVMDCGSLVLRYVGPNHPG